jgi:hypothetical protein
MELLTLDLTQPEIQSTFHSTGYTLLSLLVKTVCRHYMGDQRPQIKGQATPWPKEKGQTTIYKTTHRKPKIEQMNHTKYQGCTGRVSISSSTCDIRHVSD